MTDFAQISNGFIDFFQWFFSDFMKGACDFLFGHTMTDGINNVIHWVGEGLDQIGLGAMGVSQIALPQNANNLVILVSVALFIGVGVGLFMILKNLIFNWL